jgi:RecA-family ATPase
MDREVNRSQWTVRDLLTTKFPDPNWVIEGILPEGLTFFAGRPKVGKSWLALQIAGAVGSGESMFNRHVERRNVLYIALEDSPRRLQERLQKQGIPADATIVFRTSINPLDEGGFDDLKSLVRDYQPGLVVIDTFSRAIRKADQMEERDMKALVGDVQSFALAQCISIMFIDHHRKSVAHTFADPIDDILGSTAKAAAADGAM